MVTSAMTDQEAETPETPAETPETPAETPETPAETPKHRQKPPKRCQKELASHPTRYQTPLNRHTAAAMMSDEHREYSKLLFAARRSVRYHMYRQRFLGQISKWGSALTAIFGSVTVMSLLATQGEQSGWNAAAWAATFTAVFSAIELVFGPGRSASQHNELARDFIALEQEALRVGAANMTAESILVLQIRRLDIEAKEPPVYRVLDVICHNEVAKALGYSKKHRVGGVTWLQRLFKNIFDIGADRLEKGVDHASRA